MEMKEYTVHKNFRSGRPDYPGLKVIYAKEAGNNDTTGEIFLLAPEPAQPDSLIPESALTRCEGVTHFGDRPLFLLNADYKI